MQLSLMLMMITVIKLTSSQSTNYVIQQSCDGSSRWSNEQVLKQLVNNISQLTTAVSKLQSDVTELKTDVTELKTASQQENATGKLIC